ncbi:acyl carrier protein [Comamonas sp.]|uniref:acyl carrier protein n=1 Tax=Comamonas sp. TaxID=34028 RepID=UPI00258AD284|nr:acyl carrier protein [Comamonas sp.]
MEKNLREQISTIFKEVYCTQTESNIVPELSDETRLLETGLDSLGFAILVVTLEQELGYDPFILSQDAYYPSTFGEFIRFYEVNKPQ